MSTQTPTDITLPEVWRILDDLKTTVSHLADCVANLRTDLAKEVESQVTLRLKVQGERIGRLEKVVYGAVGVICTGVLIGLLSLVLNNRP
jgi:cell division protein FtsL